MFDFASIKAQCRQVVHDTMKVAALYSDDTLPAAVPVTARWHDKITLVGNLDNTGYAESIEGIDKIIFNEPELTGLGLTLRNQGVVTFPDYSIAFSLEVKEPSRGPIDVVWTVARVS